MTRRRVFSPSRCRSPRPPIPPPTSSSSAADLLPPRSSSHCLRRTSGPGSTPGRTGTVRTWTTGRPLRPPFPIGVHLSARQHGRHRSGGGGTSQQTASRPICLSDCLSACLPFCLVYLPVSISFSLTFFALCKIAKIHSVSKPQINAVFDGILMCIPCLCVTCRP